MKQIAIGQGGLEAGESFGGGHHGTKGIEKIREGTEPVHQERVLS